MPCVGRFVRQAPAGLGFITLFFGLGQAVGPSVAGAMADAAKSVLPAIFLAAGVALLGAIGASLLRRKGLKGGSAREHSNVAGDEPEER